MITESFYWKEELFRNAKWLVGSLSRKKWLPRSFAKLEKCLMLSAYSIRKLSEAMKIPNEFMNKEIYVSYYSRKSNSSLDYFNNHDLERYYKLDNRKITRISVRILLNQIIHSYIFAPVFNENTNEIVEIMLNSDKTKKELLYSVEFKKIIDLIMYISNGKMIACTYQRNGEDYELIETKYKSILRLDEIT